MIALSAYLHPDCGDQAETVPHEFTATIDAVTPTFCHSFPAQEEHRACHTS
jgi:hypothetical protein